MSQGDANSHVPLQLTSAYLKRYELLIEYKNLTNPNHCPAGMFLVPHPDNINVWFGTMFIHRGYYKGGVFKFLLQIPEEYPESRPIVRFITDMFHPLVDRQGQFHLRQQFATWRPHKDYICHILHYVKNSFREAMLTTLQEESCPNRDAWKMFTHERPLFGKLASQCAMLSASEGILFDNASETDNPIRFTQLNDRQFMDLKRQILHDSNLGAAGHTSLVDADTTEEQQGQSLTTITKGIKDLASNVVKFLSV